MMIQRAILITVWILLPIAIIACPTNKGWRGIVPLQSTCEDVKRTLKLDKCEFPVTEYRTSDFKVTFIFSTCTCCENWRVPPNTVTDITFSPLRVLKLSEFNPGEKFKKVEDDEIVGQERYENIEDGVTLYAFNGMISHILYYPSTKDEELRCSPPAKQPSP